jgi:hypothetical protein
MSGFLDDRGNHPERIQRRPWSTRYTSHSISTDHLQANSQFCLKIVVWVLFCALLYVAYSIPDIATFLAS